MGASGASVCASAPWLTSATAPTCLSSARYHTPVNSSPMRSTLVCVPASVASQERHQHRLPCRSARSSHYDKPRASCFLYSCNSQAQQSHNPLVVAAVQRQKCKGSPRELIGVRCRKCDRRHQERACLVQPLIIFFLLASVPDTPLRTLPLWPG